MSEPHFIKVTAYNNGNRAPVYVNLAHVASIAQEDSTGLWVLWGANGEQLGHVKGEHVPAIIDSTRKESVKQ